jgi:UDP-N-acetylmuramoyl-tripeptide--D-alanyl-D-alanine ligase
LGIVFFFQPLTVYWQQKIIKKAKEKRAKFKDLIVIGITGSYGKTSTKEFLNTILSSKFKVLSTPAHQNTDIAIAKLILEKLTKEIEIFIVEMAAYKREEIISPCQIVKPKIGILTGINEQHLATFGTKENIIKTKFELIESLPEDGMAVFNWDNNYIRSKIKNQKSKIQVKNQKFYSTKEKLDIWAEDIKIEKEWIYFKVFSKDGDSADFRVNLLGAQNVENILAAACVAKELGMSLKEISTACLKIKSWQGGIQLKKGKGGLNIIDATYSANPDGVISHLEHLKLWSGQKVIVTPCLIELGKASKEVHKRIGKKIGEICDLAIITTKDKLKEISSEAIKMGMKKENILFLENPKEILKKIKSFCQEGDNIILLEGRVPIQLVSLLVEELE